MEFTLIQIGKDKSKADITQKLAIKDFDPEDFIGFQDLTVSPTSIVASPYILASLSCQLATWLSTIPRMKRVVLNKTVLPAGSIPKSVLKKHMNEYLWKNDKSCAYVVQQVHDDKILDDYAVLAEVRKINTSMIDRYILYSTK